MEFKHFFNAYDETTGTQHTGFLQSMDFSALEESVTFLNELTWAIMDAYLYNELSESLVMRQWGHYMHYSKENARFEIMSAFYLDFVNAVTAKLIRAEKWYQLTKVDFTALSATDIKTIEHGLKETDLDYGATQETSQFGQQQLTNVHGAQGVTRNYDKVEVTIQRGQDTHLKGAESGTNGSTVTNKVYPLGASDFVNDTQSTTSGSTSATARTDTDTWGNQDSTTKARTDGESRAAFTDTSTDAQHTDTRSTIAKQDKQTIKAYVDTERHTKHIIISPEKYYQIEKELADIGAYDLMRDAVKETLLLCVWEGGYLW